MKLDNVCNIIVQDTRGESILKIVSMSADSTEEEIEKEVKKVLEEFKVYLTDEAFEYFMDEGYATFVNDEFVYYTFFIHHSE